VLAVGQFSTLGPSHLDVLVITVLGGAALIVLGRRADPSVTGWVSRVLAVAVLAVNAFSEIRLLDPAHLAHTVPLELPTSPRTSRRGHCGREASGRSD